MKPERWWDIPGVLALVVVIPGMVLFLAAYAVLSFLIHGEWPTW